MDEGEERGGRERTMVRRRRRVQCRSSVKKDMVVGSVLEREGEREEHLESFKGR